MLKFIQVHWYYFLGLLPLIIAGAKAGASNKYTGKLIGIVGKMGSGKSLFAVRMAYKRMASGAQVRTNFTMNFPILHEEPCPPKCEKKRKCVCVRKKKVSVRDGKARYRTRCLCQMKKRWAPFYGWEQLAHLDHAVVIIDEAHLMAPSYDFHAIPEIARWKYSMGRKFKLDVYWITQNEKKISAQLRNDTHNIYTCKSWFGGMGRCGAPLILTAKEWEPETIRRPKKHVSRRWYFFRLRIAELYDSLEVMQSDQLVARDGTMKLADEITKAYNSRLNRSQKASLVKAAEKDGFVLTPEGEFVPDNDLLTKGNGKGVATKRKRTRTPKDSSFTL